jgi:hypothetical protein
MPDLLVGAPSSYKEIKVGRSDRFLWLHPAHSPAAVSTWIDESPICGGNQFGSSEREN